MVPRLLTSEDESGRVVLHWACSGGRRDLVQWLREHGAHIDPKDGAE